MTRGLKPSSIAKSDLWFDLLEPYHPRWLKVEECSWRCLWWRKSSRSGCRVGMQVAIMSVLPSILVYSFSRSDTKKE